MSSKRASAHRILAIAPKSRGFGFIVMESLTTPVDWGMRTARESSIHAEVVLLTKIRDLLAHYQPDYLILEKRDAELNRGSRVRLLVESIGNHAVWQKVKIRRVSMKFVKKVFLTFGASTKQQIAIIVAGQLSELAPRLPPPRRAWMSEHHRMAIFDAAALALTFLYMRSGRSPQLAKMANLTHHDLLARMR